jgi:hypothetical protein
VQHRFIAPVAKLIFLLFSTLTLPTSIYTLPVHAGSEDNDVNDMIQAIKDGKYTFENQMITKQNQAEKECNLTVDVDDRGDWVLVAVNIPKDDKRLERLFSIRFVLGTNGSPFPWKVIVPIKVPEALDGIMKFRLKLQKNQLHDSFIEFNCRWPDPGRSDLDVCYLKIESYVDNLEKN